MENLKKVDNNWRLKNITEKPETFHVLEDITPCAKETGLDFKTFKSIGTMFNFLRQPSQINSSAQIEALRL